MGDCPSFQRPRSLSAFTRSNRFITDRLPCALPCAFRLECFDIMKIVFVVRAFDNGDYKVWQLESARKCQKIICDVEFS